jgi:hypothetical protein
MSTKKSKTNDAANRALIREFDKLNPVFHAILRERILHIAEMTEQSISENPEAWAGGLIHKNTYLSFCSIVKKHLGFTDL